MASLSRVNVQVGFQGNAAVEGFKAVESSAKRLGNEVKKATEKTEESSKKLTLWGATFGRVANSVKGANDIKGAFDMFRGVVDFFIGMPMRAFSSLIQLGSELESLQIQMGAMAGNFKAGADSLEYLRQITRDMGVPLGELVGSFKELSTAGIPTGDIEKLLRTFSAIAPLLGPGGIGQISGGIASMAKSGMADQATLDLLQNAGIPVYEALAQKLTNITGVFHDMQAAQQAVERGAVVASTAINAMQEAAKSPQALEAAQRIGNSVEGQLSRLKEGFTELLRDIGAGLIKGLDVPAFLASLRGVLDALAVITEGVVSSFKEIGGPEGVGNKLEASFKAMRSWAFDIAEAIAKGAVKAKETFDNIVTNIKAAFDKIQAFVNGGFSGWRSGKTADEIKVIENWAKRDIDNAAMRSADMQDRLEEFFKKMRTNAGWLDMQRANDLNQFAKPQEITLPNKAEDLRKSPLQQLADEQLKLRQGRADSGKIAELMNAMLGKYAPSSDGFMAGRTESGSVAAAEMMIRNMAGSETRSLQQRMADAMEAAQAEAKRQTDLETQMVQLLGQMRPVPTTTIGK